MPMYDRQCPRCGVMILDCLEPITSPLVVCVKCSVATERVWLSHPPAVAGDECDITIRHGLVNEDGSPRHFTSKAEIARVAKEKGLFNRVEHLGRQGGDRSKHTTRWT